MLVVVPHIQCIGGAWFYSPCGSLGGGRWPPSSLFPTALSFRVLYGKEMIFLYRFSKYVHSEEVDIIESCFGVLFRVGA